MSNVRSRTHLFILTLALTALGAMDVGVESSTGSAPSVLTQLGFAGLSTVQAQSRVDGEVIIVLAKEEEGEIDPSLANVPALRRPPFNSFRSMRVLSRPALRLAPGGTQEVQLPNGRKLKLELVQVMPDGRFRVRVSIERPNRNDYLPLLQVVASPGDPFFVAGQGHEGGTLVIGVRLGERRAEGGESPSRERRPSKRPPRMR